MPVSYQDILRVDLSVLVDAADAWKRMGTRFGELQKDYQTHVKSLAENGTWLGVSSISFRLSSTKTEHEFYGAKKQANAIASLLDDAYKQLTELKKKVEAERDAAVEAKMTVSADGVCRTDFSKMTPETAKLIKKDLAGQQETERYWTQRIADAVQKVADADQGVRLAMQNVTKDKDGKGDDRGFNSQAMGDIEKYEGKRAADLGTKLNSGELSAQERAEFQRLMRDNADDKAYSRTLLNTLGADGTIKMNIALNKSARVTDKGHGKEYLAMQRGLADSLATATEDTNSDFYRQWRKDMQKTGVKYFDGPLGPDSPVDGADQKIRGYQSLLTLMQTGNPENYSPQFLKDLGQDIYKAERDSKGNIWDVNQAYGGKDDGWFANDPLDSTLGIMSSHPGAATSFLDPGPDGSNGKLDYLLKERDWEGIVPEYREWHGNASTGTVDGDPEEGSDARHGFGAALEAATTCHEPLQDGDRGRQPGAHSPEQARVMQHTINTLDSGAGGEGIPEGIRKNLGRSLADYVPDTYAILSDQGGNYDSPGGGNIWAHGDEAGINVNKASLIRVMRGVSEDNQSYALLYEANRLYAAEQLAAAPQNISRGDEVWQNRAADVGAAMGAMNAVGADVIFDERDDKTAWAADVQRYSYHVAGGLVTEFPFVGDVAQRSIDAIGYEWQKDVTDAANAKAKETESKHYVSGVSGTYDLIEQFGRERNIPLSSQDDPHFQNHPLYNEHEAMRREAKQMYATSRADAASALGWN